jgi:acyl-[acyl-carrier-protein] desaturase
VLERDPNQGLVAASKIMPAIDMPGVNMPHFRELADVVRRAGIYGPRDYLGIVQELIKYWSIESLDGLNDLGRAAQEKIMAIPARLERIAEIMEKKTKPKSFAFDVVFNRVFAME